MQNRSFYAKNGVFQILAHFLHLLGKILRLCARKAQNKELIRKRHYARRIARGMWRYRHLQWR